MNTFLQLREQDAEVKNGNADFTTRLKKPISLVEGDKVILNKAILDSRSIDSGKIVLKNDTTLTANFTYYLRNFDVTGKTDKDGNTWTTADLDSDLYIWTQELSHGSQVVEEVTKIRIDSTLTTLQPPTATLTFSYYPVGATERKDVVFKLNLTSDQSAVYEKDNIGLNAVKKPGEELLILKTTDLQLAEQFLDKNTLKIETSPVPSSNSHYEPVTDSVTITLEAGSYNPDDLGQRVSELFTQLTPGKTFIAQPTGSTILLNTESNIYTSMPNKLWIKSDGDVNATSGGSPYIYKGAFQYTTAGGGDHYFFGTSQMTLEYDVNTNRFMWSRTHFPYYTSSGSEAVAMKAINASATTFKLVNQVSGILFNNLSAFDVTTGESIDFWTGILGFDLADLCVFPSHKDNSVLNSRVPFYTDLDLGEKITGGETGVDVTIDKTNGLTVPNLVDIERDIAQTVPIRANGNFGVINLSSGYFIIEIQGLNTELVTNTDIKNHIFGIISRYYENENYTSGTEADAIIYEHVGSPLYFNELKIRILDSNYQVANIGSDNTIFLQVLKQPRDFEMENKKQSK